MSVREEPRFETEGGITSLKNILLVDRCERTVHPVKNVAICWNIRVSPMPQGTECGQSAGNPPKPKGEGGAPQRLHATGPAKLERAKADHEIVRSLRRRRVREAAQVKNTRPAIAGSWFPCARDFGPGPDSPPGEIHHEVPTRTNGITI